MKSIIAIILSLAVFFTTEKNTAPATVNKSESSVMWKAAKVTGEHWGYVPIADATLDYSNGKITGGS
nr:lipid-binding protein [Algoriphagus sp.]